MKDHPFFATAAGGTEEVLAEELRELGVGPGEPGRGGVGFGARLEDAYRACLWSRVASRVLLILGRFEAADAESLYAGVHAIPWTEHVGAERTLAVSVAGAYSSIGPSHFIALKTKDAIVDRVRSAEGARPSVDKRQPDVRVVVHVTAVGATVSLDLAGSPLHERSGPRKGSAAPLKENLAAAVLRMAGWPERARTSALYDPLCGTGTLLIEAAGQALDLAPGLSRGRLGAEGWRGHDDKLLRRLREEAEERRTAGSSRECRIAGSDASPGAVKAARELVAGAGWGRRIAIEQRELRDAAPPWDEPGLVVTNPPYGERLGETGELGPVYELLGDVLKRRFPGWSAWVLSGNRALDKRIGLRPASKRGLFNGAIPCRLLEIPIASEPVAGSSGPGWRRDSDEARGFARKLGANRKRLGRWADREGIDCYRLYDAEISLYNLAVDWYAGAVRIEEYERPRKVTAADAERRLSEAARVVSEVLEVDPADVVLRVRRRLGKHEQHERYGDRGSFREVREGDLRFRVNLSDYLDTGLFLDDRLLRRWLRERAEGRHVLNLFAYTCSASVAAAAGGARSTTSVDLSKTYLEWGRRNFALNGLEGPEHRFVRADVLRYLKEEQAGRKADLIFVAPPTHSRSKAMRDELELQRDHAWLLERAARQLSREGELLFATNLRSFSMSPSLRRGLDIRELTAELTPRDFEGRPRLSAWVLKRAR